MDPTAENVRQALAELADTADSVHLQRFFKTGAGEYGEGDVFLGVRVPATRTVVKRFRGLPLAEVDELLDSPVHEHRLAGVLLLVAAYPSEPEAVFDTYLAAVERGRINNWDLVDASSEHIIGPEIRSGRVPLALLDDLAGSPDLWERRVAVLATFHFIKHGDAGPALRLCEALMPDRHDLIQKATGWMLREVGKRVSRGQLTGFLDAHAAVMPRTMLSYATEHLDPQERARYRAAR
ncbi:MAG TPA: DNA alkylation repair protein [Pseudolysinimonas sp.]|jgi:3-methyladenine DNA glycosylase AlkD|nr:DNA alkylation repair protein [Pseudolysinimonas sp.]